MSPHPRRTPRTAAVRHGVDSDTQFGAVIPPLYLSSNYSFEGFDRKRRYDYSRSGNPARDLLAEALAELEGGVGAIVCSSGMAAIALVLQTLMPGSRVLAPHDGYGGTYRLLCALHDRGQLEVQFVDQANSLELEKALLSPPALVWIETPSNPLLRVVDIAKVAALAKAVGAVVAVDNTFLSPALQNPIALGADLVVHSTTKYLGGHSDLVGGAVIARSEELFERLAWWANCLGVSGAPFDSYLTLRGVRTLHARMRVHEENARSLARFLQEHEAVGAVHYPGLPTHPSHALASRQQRGYGGMLSFELKEGAPVSALVEGLELFTLAESLGGVESLIAHPATMTHAAMSPEARERGGIGMRLLRLSVGLESKVDLIRDLDRALKETCHGPDRPDMESTGTSTRRERNGGRYWTRTSDP